MSDLIARHAAAQRFGFDYASVSDVRRRAAERYRMRMSELGTYFDLLIRLAGRAEREQLPGLFDRIERTLAEMHRRRLGRVRCA